MSHTTATEHQKNISALNVSTLVNQWLEGVKQRDVNKLLSLLHPDIRLTVPFQTDVILGNINTLETFRTFDEMVSNFIYKSVLIDGSIAALRFEGDINGERLQGVDFFHFNSAGQVEKIEVMARPLAAVQGLQKAIEGKMLNNPSEA